MAKEWEASHPGELTADEAEFLVRSLEAQKQREASELDAGQRLARAEAARAEEAEKHARQQKDAARNLRAQRRAAEKQARIAESRRLAAESSSALAKYPLRSLLLAVEAAKVAQSLHGVRVAAAEQSLREALASIGGEPLAIGRSEIRSMAISRDNQWLLTGSFDGTARLWDLSAKDPAANPVELRGHDGPVRAVAISPDNRWVVTGSEDKTARLWLLQMKDLIHLARTMVGRNFSADEWRLYFPGEKYRKTFADLPGPDERVTPKNNEVL